LREDMVKSILFKSVLIFMCLLSVFLMLPFDADAASNMGFVELPAGGFANSAYLRCNETGQYGLQESKGPTELENNHCAVTTAKLLESPMNGPLEGFNMVGMISRGVGIPEPHANGGEEFATLTDTIWRNKDTKECIFGTHILMKESKLANGQQWEINDIVRGGFAGRPVAIAYFFKSETNKDYGLPEVLFRVGRTFTSVPHGKSDIDLPTIKDAPAANKAISSNQAAAVSENWVNFTTDINYADPDGITRKMTPMLYIKTTCEAEQPVEKEGAIRLRTTGQNGQTLLEIDVPGLVPAGAEVNQY
jgi:hypothetical protein